MVLFKVEEKDKVYSCDDSDDDMAELAIECSRNGLRNIMEVAVEKDLKSDFCQRMCIQEGKTALALI